VTGDEISVYPVIRRFFKMSGSFSVMLFMVRSLVKYILGKVKRVKSVYEPSGPSGRRLSPVSVALSE